MMFDPTILHWRRECEEDWFAYESKPAIASFKSGDCVLVIVGAISLTPVPEIIQDEQIGFVTRVYSTNNFDTTDLYEVGVGELYYVNMIIYEVWLSKLGKLCQFFEHSIVKF